MPPPQKWRLAVDMLDTPAGWGMRPPAWWPTPAAYGTNARLRTALLGRCPCHPAPLPVVELRQNRLELGCQHNLSLF